MKKMFVEMGNDVFTSNFLLEQQDANYIEHGWTPLIMASKGGYTDVTEMLLESDINVNAVDQNGWTALSWACKEGHVNVALLLINKGAFIDIPDNNGDTPLILASKEGHTNLVNALIQSYANIDAENKAGETSLHVAVSRGHVTTVNALLGSGAKIDVTDKKGDTPVHVAMRNGSKIICDTLVRDPNFSSQILHTENDAGETPYYLDTCNKQTIRAMDFSTDNFAENDFEKMDRASQQELLITTMADFLVESSLSIPMTVGIYSHWGNGKSTYTQRLMELLEDFREQETIQPFTISVRLVIATIIFAVTLGLLTWTASAWADAIVVAALLVMLLLALFCFARVSLVSTNEKVNYFGAVLTLFFTRMLWMFKIIYCIPPSIENIRPMLPVHLVNVDLSRSIMVNDNPVVSIVNFMRELNDSLEKDIGIFIPRLYRLFQVGPYRVRNYANLNLPTRWKKSCCCIPSFLTTVFVITCLWISLIFFGMYGITGPNTIMAFQIACCCVLAGAFIIYLLRLCVAVYCFVLPMKKRIKLISTQAGIQEETFMSVIKQELELCVDMLECLDGFAQRQTRVVINLDLSDSLEQQKVLNLIHTLSILLTEPGHSFILIFSVDPRLLIKAVEQTLSTLSGPVVTPYDYIKKIIDLPFYACEQYRYKIDGILPETFQNVLEEQPFSDNGDIENELEWDRHGDLLSNMTQDTIDSHNSQNFHNIGINFLSNGNAKKSTAFLNAANNSSDNNNNSNNNSEKKVSERIIKLDNEEEENVVEDISQLIRDNENGSLNDVKRVMNIVSLKGRILRNCDVEFHWNRLAIWVSLCDGWPYKASWIILLSQDKNLNFPPKISLRRLFSAFGYAIPTLTENEYSNSDANGNYFDTFLSSHKPVLTVGDARQFSSVLFYVDPTIRKLMIDYLSTLRSEFSSKDISYNQPTLPVQHGSQTFSSDKYLWQQHNHEDIQLNEYSVKDICIQLSKIEGIDANLIDPYKNRLYENNISGRVLQTCDLQELREIMKMSFGDWQLFMTWVMPLRCPKSQLNHRGVEQALSYHSSSHNDSFVEDSQSESIPESPEQIQHGWRASKKRCINKVPDLKDKWLTELKCSQNSPSLCREKYRQHALGNVTQEGHNQRIPSANTTNWQRSADSGFASTETEQKNSKCHKNSFTSPINPCKMLDISSNTRRESSGKRRDFSENNTRTKRDILSGDTWEGKAGLKFNHVLKKSLSLNSSEEHIVKDNDRDATQKKWAFAKFSDGEDSHDLDIEAISNVLNNPGMVKRTSTTFSLSEIPLPQPCMLEDALQWEMSPPKEFDDDYESDKLFHQTEGKCIFLKSRAEREVNGKSEMDRITARHRFHKAKKTSTEKKMETENAFSDETSSCTSEELSLLKENNL